MLQRANSRPPALAVTDFAALATSNDQGRGSVRRGRRESTRQVVVLGDKAVGKSALVVQLMTHRFIHEYDSSTDLFYQKRLHVGDHVTSLGIWDSVTKEEDEMTEFLQSQSDTSGLVLMYSVSNRVSFEHAQRMKSAIDSWSQESKPDEMVPVFLVGSKAESTYAREVSAEEGYAVAEQLGFHAFREVSSLSGPEDAQGLFSDLILHMRGARSANQGSKMRSRSFDPQSRHRTLRVSPQRETDGGLSSSLNLGSADRSRSVGNLGHIGEMQPVHDYAKSAESPTPSGSEMRTLGALLRSGINAIRTRTSPSQSSRPSSTRPSPFGSPRFSPRDSPKLSPYNSPRVSIMPGSRSYNDLMAISRQCRASDGDSHASTEVEGSRHRLSPLPTFYDDPQPQPAQSQTNKPLRHSLDV